MIKDKSDHLQSIFQDTEVEVSHERREQLARKGQALYGKYCGTKGRGICAESFAEYHAWRGELSVIRDLLGFLHEQARILIETDTEPERLVMTERLITRIEEILGEKICS